MEDLKRRYDVMWKIINFFLVGLLVGLFGLYQMDRNRRMETEIASLQRQLGLQFQTTARMVEGERTQSGDDESRRLSFLQQDISASRENALTRAIARTRDAVVGINVLQVKEVRNPLLPSDPMVWWMFDERLLPRTIKKQVHNLGSGFIITSDGYIVTNQHVVQDAAEIVVSTTDANKYNATVVGTDPLLDMALLKIDAVNLPVIPLGDSENSIVGEWVVAIGNPYGLFDINEQPSVSVGVVSALHRDFESKIDDRLYTDMIQTDAAINHGNSGGPLVNADGVAVGMNTLIFSESGGSVGVGFAIPAHRILAAIDDLRGGGVNREFWLGIRAANLSSVRARISGLESTKGVVITQVESGSPAASAGLRVEDIILAINNDIVANKDEAGKYFKGKDLRVGDQIQMRVCRRGRIFDVPVTLAPLPNGRRSIG